MSTTLTTIRTKVQTRVKDEAQKLAVSDWDAAISAAIQKYQADKPCEGVVVLDGNGTWDYAIAGLTGFVDGFSIVRQVVYPYVTTEQAPVPLEQDEYGLIRLPAGLYLRFYTATPGATEDILVSYTKQHTLTEATSSVYATDEDALADLAAAFACDVLATLYAQTVDSSISADVVDRRSRSQEYRASAKEFRKRYDDAIGASGGATGETKAAPAAAFCDFDRSFSEEGRSDYFFHGRVRN